LAAAVPSSSVTTYDAAYCPTCGTSLETRHVDGRDRNHCPACEVVVWRNPVPTATVAVVGDAGVLCVQRAVEPRVGAWMVPGGHLEHEEAPAEAAARELREETGVVVDPTALELLDTHTAEPFEGKRVVSTGYAVPAGETRGEPTAGDEVSAVAWLRPAAVEERPFMPHHAAAVRAAWDRFG
jgi:ADP-ribose pyrophosphatase YjhB (NUDIX family)